MTVESWDPDQAVTRGPLDQELDGWCSAERYGVTGVEEVGGEPLEVALGQEEADAVDAVIGDDEWLLVEDDWSPDGLLDMLEGDGPESAALHVVQL